MLSCTAATDQGRLRDGNEDAFVASPESGLFAVADGLGGHQGGEVASQIAIESLTAFIRTSSCDPTITWPDGFNPAISCESNQLQNATMLAHRRIRHEATRRPELDGMGTTLVAGLVRSADRLTYISVGDSRLYRWRQGALAQLSEDDTWIASMLRAGMAPESLRDHKMQHMLTKALGSVPVLELTPREVGIQPGDVFLMCSDGLYGPIGDDAIAAILDDKVGNLDAAGRALIDAANDAGGPDNITVVLFRREPARV